MYSGITDKGLEALAKCCSETVDLSGSDSITDSGISFLIKNCSKLDTLSIRFCRKISGIGFLGCPQTLTNLEAKGCRFIPEGISAIVSGGGLECLSFSSVNNEEVWILSKGCPLLKKLDLSNCEDIELQGWEAIGRNCKNLEHLYVYRCKKLSDLGLEALGNGCDKLSKIFVGDENSCSSSGLEIFKRKKPDVMFVMYGE
ncbi:F-box/LRR-repeat protein 12-like [Papaver somniferum]|uniref:F-box/LRR-repeat protein 12-like n=1 Tax=Papaver somniferum TaxID=3469 RepID=UPI000E6FF861|nr:F-box/LRR-repeat protein 12-like [Papaver somniferum]